jgi:7-keto-8-aminopelargonate synthetase-like enzyme
MATDTIDYAAVIADLKARKAQMEAQFDAAIASIEAISNNPAIQAITAIGALNAQTSTINGTASSSSGVVDIQNDTFFNMSMIAATRKYLGMKRRPASTPEIVEALRRGGIPTGGGENFATTLTTGLHREAGKEKATLVKVQRGTWGLREWY